MRRLAACALALAGCAHAAVNVPASPPPVPLVKAVLPKNAPPAPETVEKILSRSGLAYVTVEPGRTWMLGFARDGRPPVLLHVVRGEAYTMVVGRLGTVPPHADAAFFRELARRNFDVPQLKIGVDVHEGVFATFEVPSRLVDGQELLEDVFTLARVVDELQTALFPELPKDGDPALPERPAPPREKELSPLPVIEAMR